MRARWLLCLVALLVQTESTRRTATPADRRAARLHAEATKLYTAGRLAQAKMKFVACAEEEPSEELLELCLYNAAVMHRNTGDIQTAVVLYTKVAWHPLLAEQSAVAGAEA